MSICLACQKETADVQDLAGYSDAGYHYGLFLQVGRNNASDRAQDTAMPSGILQIYFLEPLQ